jgi:hypothetical protein
MPYTLPAIPIPPNRKSASQSMSGASSPVFGVVRLVVLVVDDVVLVEVVLVDVVTSGGFFVSVSLEVSVSSLYLSTNAIFAVLLLFTATSALVPSSASPPFTEYVTRFVL